MKLEIRDDSQNYTAQVIKLPIKQAVTGLDNLVEVNVFGNSCLVGKDTPEDVLYLFFAAGTQLSEGFLKANNLYRDSQLNSDINEKGFFEPNGRVKALKLRGIISTGFVIPLQKSIDAMEKLGPKVNEQNLKAGDEFNSIDGVEVCRKYIVAGPTPGQVKGDKVAKVNNRLVELMVPNQFRFHAETSHLSKHFESLKPEDILVITDKWHGSSCILSKVLIAKKLTWYQKLINRLGGKIPTKEYGYIYSSGKPKSNLPKGIEGEWINDGPDYYISNIWKKAFDDFKHTLEDGISIYGELVGFTESGMAIQKNYNYGCHSQANGNIVTYVGECLPEYKMVVYRITYTKPDGTVIEFSWQQIKDYCTKYGLETVKEFFFGSFKELAKSLISNYDVINKEIENADFSTLVFNKLQESFNMEQNCKHCNTGVPAEGMTVRIDGKPHYNCYKLKSKKFTLHEDKELDKGETNIEDNN